MTGCLVFAPSWLWSNTECKKPNTGCVILCSLRYDVLGFWRDAGSPRLDPHGNVVSAAQFPILSMLARVYLCIDSTSCQTKRGFSGLGFVYNNLRQAMVPDRVEMVMFLRSNPHLIPEINKLDNELGKLLAAQAVGKAKAASVQAANAGEQVVVDVDSE